MNLYLISQNVNVNYDTYDSAVVCADNEDEARMIHPASGYQFASADCIKWDGEDVKWSTWCAAKDVKVNFIGTADGAMIRWYISLSNNVVCASYNAG